MGLLSKVSIRRAAWLAILAMCLASLTHLASSQQVPCFFIFGDSLNDVGNNNNLITLAKANYPPYGIDAPGLERGRFSNGLLVPDLLAQKLGFPQGYYIKPYTTATDSDIVKGVNYASAGSGIRDDSGYAQGDRIPLTQQVLNHQAVIGRLNGLLGSQAATALLNKCIYYINTGSNDYIQNYFFPALYATRLLYTPEQYATDLIKRYKTQLENLYDLGARKIGLASLGPLGSAPAEATLLQNPISVNASVYLFNTKLNDLVGTLNQKPAAKFTFLNTSEVIRTHVPDDFSNPSGPCCKFLANPFSCLPYDDVNICKDRNQNVFFDNVHPTQAVNIIVSNGFYSGSTTSTPPSAFPYNIQQLAQAS